MENYYEYSIGYEMVYEELRSHSDVEKVADEICELRGYVDIRMKNTLVEMGVFYVDYYDTSMYKVGCKDLEKYGLLSESGNFLLEKGYCSPIRDAEGYLIAIVGWFPGRPSAKKYITATGRYFKKKYSLFNIDNAIQLSDFKYLFIVEGIFDCIAMRSIGLPCVAIQGSEMSKIKRLIFKMFRKTVSLPDNDSVGRDELTEWEVQGNNTYVKISGSVTVGDREYKMKDCDDLIKTFDNMEEVFMGYVESKNLYEELQV